MPTLRSRSTGRTSMTEGPAPGDLAGYGRGGGMDFGAMAESLMADAQAAARAKRDREAERWKLEKQAAQRARIEARVKRKGPRSTRATPTARGEGIATEGSRLHLGPDYGQSRMAGTLERKKEQERIRSGVAMNRAMLGSM